MASNLGTIFVELNLDDKVYKQRLSETLKSTEATARGMETAWKALGVKTDAQYDAQRRAAENAYTLIKNSATSTANDIVRAEEAKVAKIKAITDQQNSYMTGYWNTLGIKSTATINEQKAQVITAFDKIKGTVDKGSQDWINIENAKNAKLKSLNDEMVGVQKAGVDSIIRDVLRWYAAYYVISEVVQTVVIAPFIKGFKAVEEYNTAVASMAAMYMTFAQKNTSSLEDMSTQWMKALTYSKAIIPVLEDIAAKTLLSGQETIALANAFARSGVFLDASNEKQIEAFTAISNALPLLTQGQEIMKQINSEIRGLMNGQDVANNMLIRTLKEVDPLIEKHLNEWRAQGTVLEHIGELLKGFIPATALLEIQWQAVKSTLDTTVTRILREGMMGTYDEIIRKTQELNSYLKENESTIKEGIFVSWSLIESTLKIIGNILSGLVSKSDENLGSIQKIAYGLSGVLVLVNQIAIAIGSGIGVQVEYIGLMVNAIRAPFDLLFGSVDRFRKTYSAMEQNIIAGLARTKEGFQAITTGVGTAIVAYDNQYNAAKKVNEKIALSSKTTTDAQAQNTRLAQAMTKEALEERAKLEAKTYDGAIKLMNQQVATMRETKVEEKTIQEFITAQQTLINQKYHSTVQKEAKGTQKVEEDILAQLTKQNNTFYQAQEKQIKTAADLKIKQGQNILAVELDAYNKQQTALTAWYNKQVSYINQSFTNEKVKQEKLNTLYVEYDKKWEANVNAKAKKDEEIAQKSINVMATVYKTIDQYSKNAIAAEIAKVEQKYKAEKALFEKGSQEYIAVETAEAITIEKLKLNAAANQAKVQQNYYSTVSGWSASYYLAVEKRLNAEANLEALSVGASFDKQKWLTERWNEEIKKRVSSEYSFYSTIDGYETTAYNKKLQLIELERQKNINMHKDVQAANQKAKDDSIKAYVEMGKSGSNFITGIKAGFADLTVAQTKWGKVGYDTVQAFANNARTQLSNNLFAVWKGNINSIEVDWTSMLDAIGQKFADTISEMLVKAAVDKITLFFDSDWTEGGSNVLGIVNNVLGFAKDLFGGSNFASGGWVPGYASGGNNRANDTVRAMLSPGEYVVDRESVQAIARQGQYGDTLLAHINPAEAALLKILGGSGTINPRTGLLEFYDSATRPPGGYPIPSVSTPTSTTINNNNVITSTYTAKQLADIAAQISENDKIIAINKAAAAEANKNGWNSLYEGDYLVNVKGYKSGEPIGGRSWVPTTELNTTVGKRYYVPMDLIQGGAHYNPGGYNGNWYYPFLRSGFQSTLKDFPIVSVPNKWPQSAGVGTTWGGIGSSSTGWYLTPDQYKKLYGGGYWRPNATYDTLNGAYVSYADMQLSNDGMYRGGGEDTWWWLNPTTGQGSWSAQSGQNSKNNLLSQVLTTVGTALLMYATKGLGHQLLTPLLGSKALATGIGAAAGTGLAGLIQGQNAEQILTNMAIAAITTGATEALSGYLAKLSAPQGMFDLSNYSETYGTLMNPSSPSVFTSTGFGVTLENAANAGLGSDAILASLSEGIGTAWDASNYSLLNMSGDNGLISTIQDRGIKWIANKALNSVLGTVFPASGDAGGHMNIKYVGADNSVLYTLADKFKELNNQNGFSFPLISARNGLSYVPRDNFMVNTHEGERILTKEENKKYAQGKNGSEQLVIKNLQVYLDGKEVKDNMKVIADGVVVARNSRSSLNPTTRLYRD